MPCANFTGTRLIQSLQRLPGCARIRPALATARFLLPQVVIVQPMDQAFESLKSRLTQRRKGAKE